jgi:hypothetical protein
MSCAKTCCKNRGLSSKITAALFITSTTLVSCATVNPDTYEITAYDKNSKIIRSIDVVVTDDRSLSVPMNAMCIAYPKSNVIARPKNATQSVKRQC